MKRLPAVAGQFYKSGKTALAKEMESLTTAGRTRRKVQGVLCPHAGLMYSGAVAGSVYSSIEIPGSVILLGPNHTGLGAQFSLMSEGEWEIPTATVPIDTELAHAIISESGLVKEESLAHLYEHSLEVQLPFLVHFRPDVRFVPITIMSASFEDCKALALALAAVIKRFADREILLVASSDMSHYISDTNARAKDKLAIDRILALDPEGLYEVVRRENITMCGYIPSTIMLLAAMACGAGKAELVKYTTSAEVSGDYDHVVGYAGIIVAPLSS